MTVEEMQADCAAQGCVLEPKTFSAGHPTRAGQPWYWHHPVDNRDVGHAALAPDGGHDFTQLDAWRRSHHVPGGFDRD